MSQSGQTDSYKIETTASQDQLDARKKIEELFSQCPLRPEDLLFNLGLYTRSSLLVKFLVMNQLYERIKDLPGMLLEFGVWLGQNIVLLENLRAIHEPFNKQRRIIGFDTFEGYKNFSKFDRESKVWKDDSYNTSIGFLDHLRKLIEAHEGANVLGHIKGNHELVVGDVEKTAPLFFTENPEAIVAFAFFDIGLYKPTKAALDAVVNNMVKGGIIVLDELTWSESPGEAIAFKEVFKDRDYAIEKCKLYPSKSIITLK